MMSDSEARVCLECLVDKYMIDCPEKEILKNVIQDKARPGLPIRGVLESMRGRREREYEKEDLAVIDELLYLYG